MSDQLRNNMFDKYYKALGCQNKQSADAGYASAHYLRAWYSSWGGSMEDYEWGTGWTWQIGASHIHEFYQNPLAAYYTLSDSAIKGGMKSPKAVEDYEASLWRQIEFYEWLQASNGPFAGGATNSWEGQYKTYPSGKSTFYDMAYVPHPVYADPGSNHWIGNQVWAAQRLAQLAYYSKTDTHKYADVHSRVMALMDKWVAWAVNEIVIGDEAGPAGFAIPANLDWGETAAEDGKSFVNTTNQPDTWKGNETGNNKPANPNLVATSRDFGAGDVGCIASWADTLIYYAAATGATTPNANGTLGEKALYQGKLMMDNMWKYGRDDIGVSVAGSNGSLVRIFEQKVHIPSSYTGTMPSGAEIKTGVTFIGLRPQYAEDADFQRVKAEYDAKGTTSETLLRYHRYWAQGDFLMTLGVLAELYPTLIPDNGTDGPIIVDPVPTTPAPTVPGGDPTQPIIPTTPVDSTQPVIPTTPVDPTQPNVPTGPTPTVPVGEDTTPVGFVPTYGDVNLDTKVDIADVILLAKYLVGTTALNGMQKANANCDYNDSIDVNDNFKIVQYIANFIPYTSLGPQ
jgi:hypothetical protein